MNRATQTVLDAIRDCPPVSRLLDQLVTDVAADTLEVWDARDMLLDEVHGAYEAMGLDYDDIDNSDVDYIGMILP